MIASEIVNMAYDLMQMRDCLAGTFTAGRRIRTDAEAPSLLTLWQKEVFPFGKSYSEYEYNHRVHKDLITSGYDDETMSDDSLIVSGSGSVKAYTFEVDAPCVVTIEAYDGAAWAVLVTHTKLTGGVERFSGSVTPPAGTTTSRISITGNYYTILKNYALYSYAYYVVPEYRRFIKIPLPADCRFIDIVLEDSQWDRIGITLNTQGNNFILDNEHDASLKIVYRPTPVMITALTDTLVVDNVAALSGAYFLAAQFSLFIDPTSGSFFQEKYEEERERLREPGSFVDIEDEHRSFNHAAESGISSFSNPYR